MRKTLRRCLLSAALVTGLLLGPVLPAQDGAALYREHCAACHDHPVEHVPPLSAIQALSPEAVHASLSTGSMRTQAQDLSGPQIAALIAYIAPHGAAVATGLTGRCTPGVRGRASHGTWNGWSPSLTNSRFQDSAAARLPADDLPRLKLKWAFNLGAVTAVRAQPSVVAGRVLIGTEEGTVQALQLGSGCIEWTFKAEAAVRGAVTLGEGADAGTVFFGDQRANVYALTAASGKLLWKVHPESHPAVMITATPRYFRGRLYQPFSSAEELFAANPKYDCCTFRGSVVALDAASGRTVWQSYTIPDRAKALGSAAGGSTAYGPSGAGIWSTPTVDEKRAVLYVATGDNYSAPPSATSDAVLAMDLATGRVLWSRQLTAGDAYNISCSLPEQVHCPQPAGPDYDFGQPPILVRLGGNSRALVIAQKSGLVHAIDPDHQGAVLWERRLGHGGTLGGSQWGSAADRTQLYVATSDLKLGAVPDPNPPGYRLAADRMTGGGLDALDLQTGSVLWHAAPAPCAADRPACSPAQSAAVTVIPGAVFSGSLDGHVRAFSTRSGQLLWDFDTEQEIPTVNGPAAHGGSLDGGGPVVVDGMVLVGSGYGQWGGAPGNVLLAFSVDGR